MNAPLNTAHKTASLQPESAVLEVAIIGAGFSGLGMGIRLKEAGISNFRIFEKGADVGGTWRDNTYPGCGCDVKSQLYSYSFEPYADWSNVYAKQGEILSYIRHCATKYGMYPFMQFNTAVTGARFDADSGLWQVSLSSGESVQARNVVAAPGPFADPAEVNFKGRDSFLGVQVHTARWNHALDLKGKRVALIGTGATGVQVAPAIAGEVAHLSVFQRTANWIMPRPDRALSDAEKANYRSSPATMKATRLSQYWYNELTAPFLILKYDLLKSQPESMSRSYLQKKVKDPELLAKLTPNFKFGCKRVLVSSDWYPTMQRDNVSLITDGIDSITPTGIRTTDGVEHAVDVIIYATGYTVRSVGAPFAIEGLNGALLNDKWRDGTEAFNGINTSGFPNLHFLVGPFTGPGHTSVIAYAEAQIDYVIQGIRLRMARGDKYVVVKEDAEQRFVNMMDKRSDHTVWKSGCSSWYLSPNGRNNTLYPGFNAEYRARIARFNPANYAFVGQDGQASATGLRDQLRTSAMLLKNARI